MNLTKFDSPFIYELFQIATASGVNSEKNNGESEQPCLVSDCRRKPLGNVIVLPNSGAL